MTGGFTGCAAYPEIRLESHRHPMGIPCSGAPEVYVTHLLLPRPSSAPLGPVQMGQRLGHHSSHAP